MKSGGGAAPAARLAALHSPILSNMEWSPAFATGFEVIDGHHRTLFRMSQDYREALDEGRGDRVYGTLLLSLTRYAEGHFRMEEQCMERLHCPAAEPNRLAHARFTELLDGFRRRYEESGYEAEEARRLVDTLDEWLAGHICRLDVQLRKVAP